MIVLGACVELSCFSEVGTVVIEQTVVVTGIDVVTIEVAPDVEQVVTVVL